MSTSIGPEMDMTVLWGFSESRECSMYRHIPAKEAERSNDDKAEVSQCYRVYANDGYIRYADAGIIVRPDPLDSKIEPIVMFRYNTRVADLRPGDLIAVDYRDLVPPQITPENMSHFDVDTVPVSYQRIFAIVDTPSKATRSVLHSGYLRWEVDREERFVVAEFKLMGG